MVSFKDITASGGTAVSPLAFQENVPKYDPSSFYNWEQDNIPLWVLEQRGETLYRQLGSPGGNPGGMTFTLSSTGYYDEALGVYDNIDDIVERIPKRLKFPVLVELCSYGALGKLDIANITCEGDGKLEFRNMAYCEDVDASANIIADLTTSPAGASSMITGAYSVGVSASMLNVSSSRTEVVFGAAASWNTNARLFCLQGPDTDRQANNLTVHIASGASLVAGPVNATETAKGNGQFRFEAYTSGLDYSIPTGDANPVFGSGSPEMRAVDGDYYATQSMLQKREEMLSTGQSTLVAYGNWFSSIKVKDCQGDIIFRNILNDGSNQYSDQATQGCIHSTENGWNIENSDVILDNNASIRNSLTGFIIKNSRVRATGHWLSWRNYTKTSKVTTDRQKNGTGVLALNTDIEFDTTVYPNSRKYINWFGKSKRGFELRNSTVRGGIYCNAFSGTTIPNGGSQLLGYAGTGPEGTSLADNVGVGGDIMTTILNAADCNESGFHLEGSDVEFMGRMNGYLNQGDGLRSLRSQVRLPQFTFNHNTGYGIQLQGSQLTYGWGLDTISDAVGETSYRKPDAYPSILYTNTTFGGSVTDSTKRVRNRANFNCANNNQNVLVTKSSSLVASHMNNIPWHYGRWGGADWPQSGAGNYSIGAMVLYTPMSHFGATPYRRNNLPGLVVTNNSDAEFVNVNYTISSVDTGKGKVAIASQGSNITFRGTSGCTTTMNYFPVTSNSQQFRSWLAAGVVATDNSNIEMTGPTKLARFGVPVLAESNSNFVAKPPTLPGTDNVLDISGYHLIGEDDDWATSANHTSLELHSTRACMVANKQSNLRLYALGGRVVGDPGGTTARDSVDVLATGYADAYLGEQNNQFELSTSGGYVKFYPNAFVSGIDLGHGPELEENTNSMDVTVRYLLNGNDSTEVDRHESGTTGGMCVRAVGGSNVDVNLVNFHMYCYPASLSGAFYNYDGNGCEYVPDVVPPIGGGNGIPGPDIGVVASLVPPAYGTEAGALDGEGNPIGGQTNAVRSNHSTGRIVTNAGNTNQIGTATNMDNQGTMYTTAGKGNSYNSVVDDVDCNIVVIGDGFVGPDIGGTGQSAGQDQLGNTVSLTTNRPGMYYRNFDGTTPGVNADNNLYRDPGCMGTQIHIWNIADTSRVHASNTLVNGLDPETASLGDDATGSNALNYHGPGGKWWNGVSLDYFGQGGRRTTYGSLGNSFHNCGIYRLMFSTRGDLKAMYDVSCLSSTYSIADGYHETVPSGGSFVDQVNGGGYTHFTQTTRMLGTADTRNITNGDCDMPGGVYESSACLRVFGWGNPAPIPTQGPAQIQMRLGGFSGMNAWSGANWPDSAWMYSQAAPAFPIPPLNMDWQGYLRNWFDETASNTWQNAKHLAEDKVNGVSIYRSHRSSLAGGEGREAGIGGVDGVVSYGKGVRSLNLFEFERLM